VSVSGGLPSGEASEPNEATTEKKRRVSKKPSSKSFFKLLKNCGYHNIWLFKEIPFVMQQPTLSYSVFKTFHEVLQKNAQPCLIEKKKNSQQLWCFYSLFFSIIRHLLSSF
jgi:hypothetical protein